MFGQRAQQRVHELRARVDDVLAVVEHEQELARRAYASSASTRLLARRVGDAERHRDRPRHEPVFGKLGEVDEPDAVDPRIDLPPRRLQREPRLARTAEPGDRDEPALAQELLELVELALAADEARKRRRQVVPGLHGSDGYDLLAQDRALELLQLLARLEAELAVEERRAPRR